MFSHLFPSPDTSPDLTHNGWGGIWTNCKDMWAPKPGRTLTYFLKTPLCFTISPLFCLCVTLLQRICLPLCVLNISTIPSPCAYPGSSSLIQSPNLTFHLSVQFLRRRRGTHPKGQCHPFTPHQAPQLQGSPAVISLQDWLCVNFLLPPRLSTQPISWESEVHPHGTIFSVSHTTPTKVSEAARGGDLLPIWLSPGEFPPSCGSQASWVLPTVPGLRIYVDSSHFSSFWLQGLISTLEMVSLLGLLSLHARELFPFHLEPLTHGGSRCEGRELLAFTMHPGSLMKGATMSKNVLKNRLEAHCWRGTDVCGFFLFLFFFINFKLSNHFTSVFQTDKADGGQNWNKQWSKSGPGIKCITKLFFPLKHIFIKEIEGVSPDKLGSPCLLWD